MNRFPWMSIGLYGVLTLASIPLMMEWVPPNRWYGFRLPGTLIDSALWYSVNATGGKMLILSMLICAVLNLAFLWKGMDKIRPHMGIINIGLIFLSFWIVSQGLLDMIPG